MRLLEKSNTITVLNSIKESTKKPVKVKLYGKWQEYPSVEEAKLDMLEAMSFCDPEAHEYSRYAFVLQQLIQGATTCYDDIDEMPDEIEESTKPVPKIKVITDIEWETDGDQEALSHLPKYVKMPEDINADEVADYLSDEYGWLVNSCDVKWVTEDEYKKLDESIINEGYMGVEGAEYINRGNWSDGAVRYRGFIYNSYEIQEALADYFEQELKDAGKEIPSDNKYFAEFDKWINENPDKVASEVESLLYDYTPESIDSNLVSEIENEYSKKGLYKTLESWKKRTDIPEETIDEWIKMAKEHCEGNDFDEEENVAEVVNDIVYEMEDEDNISKWFTITESVKLKESDEANLVIKALDDLKDKNFIFSYDIEEGSNEVDYIITYGLPSVGSTERVVHADDHSLRELIKGMKESARDIRVDIESSLVDENDFYGYSNKEELEDRIEDEESLLNRIAEELEHFAGYKVSIEENIKESVVDVQYIGKDDWDRHIVKDPKTGRFYGDINLTTVGKDKDLSHASWHTYSGNDPYDGEPDMPVKDDIRFNIINPEAIPSDYQRFEYALLSRLESDCKYFLGNGNGFEGHLWAGSVDKQIAKMRELYDTLEEKPEWITMEDIDNYEKQMKEYKPKKEEE